MFQIRLHPEKTEHHVLCVPRKIHYSYHVSSSTRDSQSLEDETPLPYGGAAAWWSLHESKNSYSAWCLVSIASHTSHLTDSQPVRAALTPTGLPDGSDLV